MKPRGLASGFLLLALAACGGTGGGDPQAEASSASGRLVIIGGALQADNIEVYQAILDGRDGTGPICVFPTASAEPLESMGGAVERFDAVGGEGTAEGIFLTVDNPDEAGLAETVTRIESCGGFYFSGGSQSRIVQVFRPEEGDSPAYRALIRRHQEGAVVSGTSAGAAIMTDPMIGGGSSLGALRSGVRAPEGEEGVILMKGLGFWEGAFVDQHFLARGRWARLLVAVLATDGFEIGMGIDENTALVVDGSTARVVGESGVVFFDTRNVVRDEAGHAGSEVSLSLLGPGDSVDLQTGAVLVPDSKRDVPPLPTWPQAAREAMNAFVESWDTAEEGLFERWAFLRFMVMSGGAANAPVSSFAQDGYTFEFEKAQGFRMVAGEGEGVQQLPRGLSIGPFRLSVTGGGGE